MKVALPGVPAPEPVGSSSRPVLESPPAKPSGTRKLPVRSSLRRTTIPRFSAEGSAANASATLSARSDPTRGPGSSLPSIGVARPSGAGGRAR